MVYSTTGKQRIQNERMLLSQYIAEQYPDARVLLQVYVGPINPDVDTSTLSRAEFYYLGNSRRRADAVVILPDKVVMIEAYIHVHLGKLSQLMTYMELFPRTPELSDYAKLPLQGVLLGAQRDPILDQMAARFNIPVVIYQPAWVQTYLASVDSRKSRERKNTQLQP